MRTENPPERLWEMTQIEGIFLSDVIPAMNDGYKCFFDGQMRSNAQPHILHLLHDAMQDSGYQTMKRSSSILVSCEVQNSCYQTTRESMHRLSDKTKSNSKQLSGI